MSCGCCGCSNFGVFRPHKFFCRILTHSHKTLNCLRLYLKKEAFLNLKSVGSSRNKVVNQKKR